jgi:hypothetical protein
MTSTNLLPETQLTPEQAQIVVDGINDILVQLGRQPEDINGWWNHTRFAQLGDATLTQAWLRGDREAVRQLVVSLHQRSVDGARRALADPATAQMIREQVAKLH